MIFGFDIEIADPFPDDGSHWSTVAPLGVTCAALVGEDDQGMLWYSAPDQRKMSDAAVLRMIRFVVRLLKAGHQVITLNGTGFDWHELAFETGDFELLSKVARATYDPCYAMLKLRGFPVGLDAMAVGCGFEGKRKDVGGELAVKMWNYPLLRPKVLDYVTQDARSTMQIGQHIRNKGHIKWVTSRQSISDQQIAWLPTSYYMNLPMPDQSWWRDGPPPAEEGFIGWLQDYHK